VFVFFYVGEWVDEYDFVVFVFVVEDCEFGFWV